MNVAFIICNDYVILPNCTFIIKNYFVWYCCSHTSFLLISILLLCIPHYFICREVGSWESCAQLWLSPAISCGLPLRVTPLWWKDQYNHGMQLALFVSYFLNSPWGPSAVLRATQKKEFVADSFFQGAGLGPKAMLVSFLQTTSLWFSEKAFTFWGRIGASLNCDWRMSVNECSFLPERCSGHNNKKSLLFWTFLHVRHCTWCFM